MQKHKYTWRSGGTNRLVREENNALVYKSIKELCLFEGASTT
ncbi:hypothetical protein XIS1_30002 [Xenorhabdus innexi]|uniref:Uncharacterized protein n=1 Tax=Xenorhabdus innexi TaxID=290109 RepID=A0A1N6MXG3_9GAMM|nr:hypothetical protein XIS1_30002 [Xenorhabdus innexi]